MWKLLEIGKENLVVDRKNASWSRWKKTKGFADIKGLKMIPSAKFISFLMEQLFGEMSLASSWEKSLKKTKEKKFKLFAAPKRIVFTSMGTARNTVPKSTMITNFRALLKTHLLILQWLLYPSFICCFLLFLLCLISPEGVHAQIGGLCCYSNQS